MVQINWDRAERKEWFEEMEGTHRSSFFPLFQVVHSQNTRVGVAVPVTCLPAAFGSEIAMYIPAQWFAWLSFGTVLCFLHPEARSTSRLMLANT